MSDIDASKLVIEPTTKPSEPRPNEDLVFGKYFSDHMLEIEWTEAEGWGVPKISGYHPLLLDPSTVVFHYAFELFEGMKAYRDKDNNIRTFRSDKNMARMNNSAARASMPTFDGEELMKCIDKLVLLDKKFVPFGAGYSLYLRPTMIGTTPTLGVHEPDRALLYVICSPVGPYYKTGFKPVSLEATDYAVRAWPGGVGGYKLGANYVSCIQPQTVAASKGHQQNLWLFGEEGYVTEVGAMNAMFVFKDEDNKKELVTAPLDGTILPGVTRDSVLQLARARLPADEWTISERKFTIHEVAEKASKGQLVEAFGCGTAAIVSPINNIGFQDKQIPVPCGANGVIGDLTQTVADWIRKIQYGEEEFADWSRVAK